MVILHCSRQISYVDCPIHATVLLQKLYFCSLLPNIGEGNKIKQQDKNKSNNKKGGVEGGHKKKEGKQKHL